MVHDSIRAHLVSINPTTPEAIAAVAKYGNVFWRRYLGAGATVLLIPVVDGIPRVAEFIIVPAGEVTLSSDSVGYGKE
jgi:hypothetical protein